MLKLLWSFVALAFLAGCAAPPDVSEILASKESQGAEEAPAAEETPVVDEELLSTEDETPTGSGLTPWECETEEDALGDKEVSCQSTNIAEDTGMTWVLTFFCDESDGWSDHSIIGIRPDMAIVRWGDDGWGFSATVRIDDKEKEEWDARAIGEEADGFGFGHPGDPGNIGTWDLLTHISSASKLAFRILDREGVEHDASIDVADSVPVADTFSALGCSGTVALD